MPPLLNKEQTPTGTIVPPSSPPPVSHPGASRPLSKARRWIIFAIGVIETFLFGGSIFGWAQLVYVLKNEGIFSDLCNTTDIIVSDENDLTNGTSLLEANDTVFSNGSSIQQLKEHASLVGCKAQDRQFALVYTIACLSFGLPACIMGFIIHHWGLYASRVIAASFLTCGFLSLGFTTSTSSHWLYISMILIALGGNLLRLSVLQFCNLFPKYLSTSLAIISGSFASSAALFMIFQLFQSAGFSLLVPSTILAGLAFLSLPATLLMPKFISFNQEGQKSHIMSSDVKLPFRSTLLSLSVFTHVYWLLVILMCITAYSIQFNSWISQISKTKEEAGHYSLLISVSCLLCPLIAPFPGLLTDYISKSGILGSTTEERIKKELQSPIASMVCVIIVTLFLRACLCFNAPAAIYVSIAANIIVRPWVISVGTGFLRIRFPAHHFNRLVGIVGTVISLLNALQYPLFIWVQLDPTKAMIFFLCVLLLTFVQPFHLLWTSYINKVVLLLLPLRQTEQKPLIREAVE